MDFRKSKYVIFIACLFLFFLFPMKGKALEKVSLYLFYSKSCPHCAAEKVFLEELKQEYSNLEVELLEVTTNKANSDLLHQVKNLLKTENNYVPYTVIGKIGLTGYNENIASQIRHFVELYSKEGTVDLVEVIRRGEDVSEIIKEEEDEEKEQENTSMEDSSIVVPILGKINPKKVSLPLLAVIIGTVDGFNPCAMWVLIFLIGMLMGMKNHRKMWILGLTFLISSAFVYLLFMVSWLKIALSISSIRWIQGLIACVALLAGFFNLSSFWKSKDAGCTIVKEEKRKKTFGRIQKIISEKHFLLAFLGIIALAFSVNLVELACSAGLPLLFTQVLALNNLYTFDYMVNILIYIFFFLLDDLIIFFLAMVTMQVSGISNKYTKYSHLIGGIIMILIGVLLLLKPEWLMFQFY